jgi:hypothetical protein
MSVTRRAIIIAILAAPAIAFSQTTTGWNLIWSDEFSGENGSPPDPARWKATGVHQVLPDGHGVAATRKPQFNRVPIGLARARRGTAARLRVSPPVWLALNSAPKSVVTSLAGFETTGSVSVSMAR